jgi:hypothetical protein
VEDDGMVTGVALNRMGRDDLRLRVDSVISGMEEGEKEVTSDRTF